MSLVPINTPSHDRANAMWRSSDPSLPIDESSVFLFSPSALPQDGLGTVLVGTGYTNYPRYTMRSQLASNESAQKRAATTPGPGVYEQSVAFGSQTLSARSTAASFGFGTSRRSRPELEPKKTMYIGKEYERQNIGVYMHSVVTIAVHQLQALPLHNRVHDNGDVGVQYS